MNKYDKVRNLLDRLYPICRSITGDGVRETLNIIKEYCSNLNILEFPSGKNVYDWEIPKEWNIKDAYIKDSKGIKIVDFKKSNLHVLNYSTPISKNVTFAELKEHLLTLPDLPDAIPYRTSYYKKNWGFCISQNQYNSLNENEIYEVFIDSKLEDGFLTIGEVLIPGKSNREILISTYCCHPSLANDNLSGIILTTLLIEEIQNTNLENSYRILFLPETIGAITYLYHNESILKKYIIGGFVVTTVGGTGKFGYKTTFLGNHFIDRCVRQTFREYNLDYIEYPFVPDGSDERQYSSPGFRFPMSTICKDKYYEYSYYHTSLDNLDYVLPENILKTFDIYKLVLNKFENNKVIFSLNPNCEVQLGKRSLYPEVGGAINQLKNSDQEKTIRSDSLNTKLINQVDAILWILFLADGKNTTLDISEKTDISFEQVVQLLNFLENKELIKMENMNL